MIMIISFTELILIALVLQAHSKYFLAEVEDTSEVEKTRNGGGLIPGSVELENTMVKNEAEEEEGNDEIVDNGVEYGSDYMDYGSMFFGGIYLSLFISLKFYID